MGGLRLKTITSATLIVTALFLGPGLCSGALITADTRSIAGLPPVLVVVDLPNVTDPSQDTILGNGYTVTFDNVAANEGVVKNTTAGVAAVPVAGELAGQLQFLSGGIGSQLNTVGDGPYLSTGLGKITITFDSPQNVFGLLWGSIDWGNQLSFNDAAGTVVTGRDIQKILNPDGSFTNGYQGFGGSAYVIVRTDAFTSVTATSDVPSFEFDGVAAGHAPEPASCLLFGLGMGSIALAAYRRRSKRA